MLHHLNPIDLKKGDHMGRINNALMSIFAIFALSILAGCAAGSATAAYSLKSQSADSLTAEAERRIIERTKREVMNELSSQNNNCCYE